MAFSAPLSESEEQARRHIRAMGPLERFFALESPLAHATCRAMCALRPVAQWLGVATALEWRVGFAPQGVVHTWPAFAGGMNGIIVRPGWRQALESLVRRRVPAVLARGGKDPVPVVGLAEEPTRGYATVRAVPHAVEGHDLPVTFHRWAVDQVLATAGPLATRLGPGHSGPGTAVPGVPGGAVQAVTW